MNSKRLKSLVILTLVCTLTAAFVTGCKKEKKEDTTVVEPEKRGKITVSVYDRGSCDPKEGSMTDNRWTKWINENGPVDVTYVPVPRWEATKQWPVMFASGTAPDLILEYDANSKDQLYSQKLLMPLDDLIAKHSTEYKNLTEKYPSLLKFGKKTDGKVYEFVRLGNMTEGKYLAYRADWLKKLNLKVPQTTDELFNVMKAFAKNDPDGNGKEDTFGFNPSGPGQFLIGSMFGLGTVGADWFRPWYIENGKHTFDWNRVKSYAEFQKKLYDDGIIDKDFLNDKNGEKAAQDWMNGKLGFAALNSSVSALTEYTTLKKNAPDAEIAYLELPQSSYGKFNLGIASPLSGIGVINASCKDPVSVVKYIDFMISDKAMKYLTLGPDGTYYKQLSDGKYQEIDPAKTKLEKGYLPDYLMPQSGVLTTGKYEFAIGEDAVTKARYEVDKLRSKAYRKNEPKQINMIQNLPALTDELNISFNDGSKMVRDIISQTIVGGSSKSVDKGIQEAQDAWKKAGGEKVTEYYEKWYQEHKSDAITNDDLYKFPWSEIK